MQATQLVLVNVRALIPHSAYCVGRQDSKCRWQ